MKRFFIIYLILFILLIPQAQAVSDYVLPYPSFMPGSIFYKLDLAREYILKFWYFGDFGQFTYNLKESDKYLVQAKTLYEYNQFLLATQALKKSDNFFGETLKYLNSARKSGKNINGENNLLKSAAAKHIEVLKKLARDLPSEAIWEPEKETAHLLKIKNDINISIKIREKYL